VTRAYCILILVSGVVGAMIAGLGPRGEILENPSENVQVHLPKQVADRVEESDNSYAGQEVVAIKREPDGHFYADVEINNMPIRILIDTGASGIALSRDDARKAGVATSIGMYDVVGEGAGGDVRGEFVTLDSVKLGRQRAEKVPAIILDGGKQSLLGQSFLRQFEAVEIKDDTMVLR
jgi:aspartyl protease family protein